ncbi:MAG: hypothetical protein ACO2O6_06565 [Candidatus Hydrothermia bacterium]
MSLWSIVALGCKRGEKVAEVAQEDIDFAIQSIEEITQTSSNTLQDPGSPVVKRYTYNGYFLFVSDTGINLKNKCVTYNPQNPADSDGDKVYPNDTITFTCNSLIDTVIKNNETHIVNYTLIGSLVHSDLDDNNPFIFSVSWGEPFKVILKAYRNNTLVENKNYSQTGSIKMEKVNDNDSVYRLIRSINHMGNDLTCRSVSVNETIYVFLNEASGWKPGDTLGDKKLKTWPIGKGTLKTCSNIDVNLSFSPTDTDTLRIGKCPSGNVGITSGKLRIVLELPTGPKEIIKPFSCTQ